jgi:cytochrome c nitrite reductase small subunit
MRRLLELGAGTTLVLVLVGIMIGVGTFTFTYGEGHAYLSTNPEVCANCHIMQPQYDAWTKSSHHAVAGCVDCHLPAEGLTKYISKMENGFNHSWAFTFQNFHEPIQIKARNAKILQDNCIRCHEAFVDQMLPVAPHHSQRAMSDPVSCVQCHAAVGHGTLR